MTCEKGELLVNPVSLLQRLIRMNTVNPPGNETECTKYIYNLLKETGFEPVMYGKTPERQNLVVKLRGREAAPPFLMYGHADVVSAEGQDWKFPPFEGILAEDCIWGRGSLDMKSAIAMMLCALLRLKSDRIIPPGDIIMAVVCDEESGGEFGAEYLTQEHAGLFKDVRYAIGEIGGFTMHMGTRRFYPIMVSEKQRCTIRIIIKGTGGHGSMPVRGEAMSSLSRILRVLDKRRLPVHITPPVKQMLEAMAQNMPFLTGGLIKSLLNPVMTDRLLDLLGDKGSFIDPVLHNTAAATVVRGGSSVNVIPGEIELILDGRILPGLKKEDFLDELKELLGEESEMEITYFSPGPSKIDMGLFDVLADVLKEKDRDAVSIPYVVPGVTDARFFSRLGIQTYGFTPMQLPRNINPAKLIHNADERIPVKALEFGTDAIFQLLLRL